MSDSLGTCSCCKKNMTLNTIEYIGLNKLDTSYVLFNCECGSTQSITKKEYLRIKDKFLLKFKQA